VALTVFALILKPLAVLDVLMLLPPPKLKALVTVRVRLALLTTTWSAHARVRLEHVTAVLEDEVQPAGNMVGKV
jgi:hypothetical protein